MNNKKTTPKIPVTIFLAIGGHTYEALCIVNKLSLYIQPSYIICEDNLLAEHKIEIPGPITNIKPSLYSSYRKITLSYFLLEIHSFLSALVVSLKHLKKFKSHAIISVGSGPSFATIVAAKLLRKKVIFIESACRIKSRSMCGNIVYKFFADLFIVQWKEQLKVYPKATYAGRPF